MKPYKTGNISSDHTEKRSGSRKAVRVGTICKTIK